MKILWTFIQMAFAMSMLANAPNSNDYTNFSHLPKFNEQAIEERLLKMDCLLAPKMEDEVRSFLRAYLTYGYRDTEIMLGRTALYFPIIEHYLQAKNLPEHLKYLPIIESSLRPYAVSTAGAVGLWQFMKGTAQQYGLKVNTYLDERKDPYKATMAALNYLSNLYDKFGSWELALAAYNCGSGNVYKAIRLSGSTDYWKLRRYLPRETQKYIPRFIAASYLVNHYHLHGLLPNWPSFEQQWTRTIKVYDYVSFKDIVNQTGISWKTLKELNPAFKRSVLPRNEQGNFLILPEMSMIAFQNWQVAKGFKPSAPLNWKKDYIQTTYTVLTGDSIQKLAKLYSCSVNDIVRWNNLKSKDLYYRQELTLYHRKTNDWRKA